MISSIANLPFLYLIGVTNPPRVSGYVVESGYGSSTGDVGYLNLRDEHNTGRFCPCLPEDDIDAEYHEPAPHFGTVKFYQNITEQLRNLPQEIVEPDNIDTYTSAQIRQVYTFLQDAGKKVLAKNPANMDDPLAIVTHPAVVGVVVEGGAGTAPSMDALRRKAGRPDLPIRFVYYGASGKPFAQARAQEIGRDGFLDMGVTHSPDGEYTSVQYEYIPIKTTKPAKDEEAPMWRNAYALDVLKEQYEKMWPDRREDGFQTIGDERHCPGSSDHCPNEKGAVTAVDIMIDYDHPGQLEELAEKFRTPWDPRVAYIIWNKRIANPDVQGGAWRAYNGESPHTDHIHLSLRQNAALYDSRAPWDINLAVKPTPGPSVPGNISVGNVTATMFQDSSVAYVDVAQGWNERYGVSLPYRKAGKRPKVRVISVANGRSAIAEWVDVGPWNKTDNWAETGARPRAESQFRNKTPDDYGRIPTQDAGIDLTPALNNFLGCNGKCKVNVEILWAGDSPIPTPEPEPIMTIDEAFDKVDKALADLRLAIKNQPVPVGGGVPLDLSGLLQSLAPLLKDLLPVIIPLIAKNPTLLAGILKLLGVGNTSTTGLTGANVATGTAIGVGGIGLGTILMQIIQAFTGG